MDEAAGRVRIGWGGGGWLVMYAVNEALALEIMSTSLARIKKVAKLSETLSYLLRV